MTSGDESRRSVDGILAGGFAEERDEIAQLGVVGGQDGAEAEQVDDDRQHRCRIDDARHARRRRGLDRRSDRGRRDLCAHQYAPGQWQHSLQAPPDMVGGDRSIRAGTDGYLVLAVIVDDNQRHARRFAGEHCNIADVDALVAEFGQGGRTGVIGTDCTDETHDRAGAGSGNSGVGTFASAVGLQSPADHRLTRARQPRRGDDEVDVDGADHDDCWRLATHQAEATQRLPTPRPGRR